MSLLKNETVTIFDTDTIAPGFLVYAKHKSWEEGVNGFITQVSENEITAQYFSGPGCMTNFVTITAREVENDEWLIRWSKELLDFNTEGV